MHSLYNWNGNIDSIHRGQLNMTCQSWLGRTGLGRSGLGIGVPATAIWVPEKELDAKR